MTRTSFRGLELFLLLIVILSGCTRSSAVPATPPGVTPSPALGATFAATSIPTSTPASILAPTPTSIQTSGQESIQTPTPGSTPPPAAPGGLKLVGHIGGSARAIYVLGDTMYLGQGAELGILDVSDPVRPRRVGYVVLPEIVRDIYVMGDTAFVADGDSGLWLVDVSNPAEPAEIRVYDTLDFASGVVVREELAYVADDESGLRILDISNPDAPTEVGFYDDLGHATDLALGGDYAYVATWTGLRVVDVSNPGAPIEVGQHETPSSVQDVTLWGDYAYVVDPMALRVLDVSNPTRPTEIGSYITSPWPSHGYAGVGPGDYAEGIAIHDNHAYVVGNFVDLADHTSGLDLLVLDMSDPTLPTLVGSYNARDGVYKDVSATNGIVYLAGDAPLRAIDVSTPTNLVEVGVYQTPIWPSDLTVAGDYAYVLDIDRGFHVVDISDPAAPAQVGMYALPEGYTSDMDMLGDYVYVLNGFSTIRVVDVSDPSRPVEVSFFDGMTEPRLVAVADGFAYVVGGSNSMSFWVVDISNPTLPTEVGFYGQPGSRLEGEMEVVENRAYIVGSTGFQIMDISDPTAPTPVGVFHPGYAQDIVVADDRAYLAEGYSNRDSGLRTLDVSIAAGPVEVSFYDTPASAQAVTLAGSYAYVLDFNTRDPAGKLIPGSLLILNISDPRLPAEVDSYRLPANTEGRDSVGVTVADDTVYVATGFSGLYIFQQR